ncbi:MAG TPA: cyclic nucleotide-binding domain-containing protein [Gammaproteobacteria bacterium]|nr:cyclic nucleotide-binding domain-containing protein [Gammaproteobacteria bacterium]
METPFKFLRPPEYMILEQKAERRSYAPGEVLVKQGEKPRGITVILKGKVKVVRESMGFNIELAEHGPGEVFGEMSFIEAEPANTSVVAAEETQALFISHEIVSDIIKQNPGFFGRFFQSLAYILSQRLRATTGMVGGTPVGGWSEEG